MKEEVRTEKERQDLKKRTQDFALRIMKMVDSLLRTVSGYVVAKQIVRSGTSVAANYRATQRARSKAEFISKMHIVLEEVDETFFWLSLIMEGKLMPKEKMESLYKEANDLTAIFTSSLKTLKKT